MSREYGDRLPLGPAKTRRRQGSSKQKGSDNMNDKDPKDLENPETWDWENAETESGTKNRRTVVSVAFPREEFKKVADCAQKAGMSLSAFIRQATTDAAEDFSLGTQKSKMLPSEPGTYETPTLSEPVRWMTTVEAKTQSFLEVGTTNARPPRQLKLISE
jgi:hypothetical protein